MVAIESDFDLDPLNLGMVAAYYYTAYTTIELFASSLKPGTKLKGALEILSWASEFDDLPVRPGKVLALALKTIHSTTVKLSDSSLQAMKTT